MLIASLGSCAVAFSGGVDSAVVAKAAQLALGERAVAVTGTSASLAAGELDEARRWPADRHSPRGDRDRRIRQSRLRAQRGRPLLPLQDRTLHAARIAGEPSWAVAAIVNGANLDDLGDYRPGMQAAREHRVRSPLAECELGKADVRELAAEWNLPVWDKPATPCLSSRVAYGEEVTPERLAMIDRAEQFLRTCRAADAAGALSQR